MGILAHVDAGKTTLTERLLYAAGVIDEIGSVDKGTTQTDSLALERQRGITIKSAVVSFPIRDVSVNLIDTPGHPDFIAEVERVLGVLDGAVLVVSAVEGVQAQTGLLMRALQRLRVPTLFFVNKADRLGADCERVLEAIEERLTPAIVPMGWPSDLGTPAVSFTPYGAPDEELTAQAHQARVHPVFFGSALTGAGVDDLSSGIAELLPARAGDGDGPVSGTVFKIDRGPSGEKIAYVRMFSGSLRTRDRVRLSQDDEQKVTAISVFEDGSSVRRAVVAAGEIATVWGLADARIGDSIGVPNGNAQHHFAPPTLETVVVPRQPGDKGALRLALTQLEEHDPLINVRQDDAQQEFSVALYGEVQKEVIEATLANDFGLEVDFRETTPICVERPAGAGEAVERLHAETNPYNATIGLRVDPASAGSGVEFRLGVPALSAPLHAYKTLEKFTEAMERYVREALQQGLSGWEVTDCLVTMTECMYSVPDGPPSKRGPLSRAADFRKLTPLVLRQALEQAGSVVCVPIHRFRLDFPADTLKTVFPALSRLGAVVESPQLSDSWGIVEGEIPAARMHTLQLELRGLTRGEGSVEFAFDHYAPVSNGEARVRS